MSFQPFSWASGGLPFRSRIWRWATCTWAGCGLPRNRSAASLRNRQSSISPSWTVASLRSRSKRSPLIVHTGGDAPSRRFRRSRNNQVLTFAVLGGSRKPGSERREGILESSGSRLVTSKRKSWASSGRRASPQNVWPSRKHHRAQLSRLPSFSSFHNPSRRRADDPRHSCRRMSVRNIVWSREPSRRVAEAVGIIEDFQPVARGNVPTIRRNGRLRLDWRASVIHVYVQNIPWASLLWL